MMDVVTVTAVNVIKTVVLIVIVWTATVTAVIVMDVIYLAVIVVVVTVMAALFSDIFLFYLFTNQLFLSNISYYMYYFVFKSNTYLN
jgi:hypothetical protein